MMKPRAGVGLRLWLVALLLAALWGGWGYGHQVRHGLAVTGMSDAISWGLYIGNFAFLVGLAASAVILLLMAHVPHQDDTHTVVLLGETMAVTAVTMSLLFVVADLGQPWRIWHALPLVGQLNFPRSIMAWDVVVLTLYLLSSLGLAYRMFARNRQGYPARSPKRLAWPILGMVLLLGLSIHTVTAFLLAANPARPLWHTAILAPRFLVSAFASGTALLIFLLTFLNIFRQLNTPTRIIGHLARVMLFSLLLNLFFMGAELFVLFYRPTGASASAQWLFFSRNNFFTHWIHTAWGGLSLATLLLLVPDWQRRRPILLLAALLTFVGVWMEKGLGLIIPGFVPTPLGEVAAYVPTWTEIRVSVGIWAMGAVLLTFLVRAVARMAR
ncbi:MAG: polysulfide reductase NrfD [Magnetococcales bacterium]|nr:polysulfide reductase NrfD [Magnetococcales bacterium]